MTKKLTHIISGIDYKLLCGSLEKTIESITFDSRKVQTGSLFVALVGTLTDGHAYLSQAAEGGASVLLIEKETNITPFEEKGITVLLTPNTRQSLGSIAAEFYDHPSSKIKLIGITGTNGKTTIATLLYELFMQAGYKSGLISTVRNCIADAETPATHTTPDILKINELLSEMCQEECLYCFAEVSSHALTQGRVEGLQFHGAIFSNITHDHLDYHKTFTEYLKAKKLLFDQLPSSAFALINHDDKNGKIIAQNTRAEKYTYGLKSLADFKTKLIEQDFNGMLLRTREKEYWSLLTGTFNAYNLTAVFAAAVLCGLPEDRILTLISSLSPVKGRLETVNIQGITAIVDYAHTPDALENILKTINTIKRKSQRLILIVGAGGNRDKQKRPLMGKIAAAASDLLILTSDNPRDESPEQIIDDIFAGVSADKQLNTLKITQREEAIKTAVLSAKKEDIILIAGKGHETYQEIKGKRKHFDDKELVINYLKFKTI
ncbi:MAG: UDP-N-acetylmuramoyl-L-alanyl-D-glutamate--2,6-diaminopimelate ligase [Bacteroidia bacterium]|nr:MAG: UDP-N-acetylmuramoyl-L-alanyl-D-glutamate--2,6-diaminopimelate ligase [Bacteroidia bacterium]